MKRIQLVETRKGCAIIEREPRYEIWFDGKLFFTLYHNLTGYVGYLPCPEGGKLDIGEHPISTFRKEVAKLNREFATPNP